MITRALILEDAPERIPGFKKILPPNTAIVWTDSPEVAIWELRNSNFDLVFLDHDLGKAYSGAMVANTMAEEELNLDAVIIIHSVNVVGAKNMFNRLSLSHETVLFPFPTLINERITVG